MKKGVIVGLGIAAIGILIIMIYGLINEFQNILGALDFITGFAIGLILVGLIVLFISVVIEQQQGKKEMKEKINKEDLEP